MITYQRILLCICIFRWNVIHTTLAFSIVPTSTTLATTRITTPRPCSFTQLRKFQLSTRQQQQQQQRCIVSSSSKRNEDDNKSSSSKKSLWLKKAASLVSKTAAMKMTQETLGETTQQHSTTNNKLSVQLVTLFRVGIPSIAAGIIATLIFPAMAMGLTSCLGGSGTGALQVLSQDSSQFVQNFLTVSGLLFSILVGQTYYFMYQQQEAIYYALFNEVTEAKSLVEQVALVCQGRSMYGQVLSSLNQYVQTDLKQLQADPAVLLSSRPMDDPLEAVMYLTSVGVPSSVYDTVRSLRQARAGRLGALQRKLPQIHMLLLWLLAFLELVSFPLLGAGTQTIGGYRILTVEGILFGVMTFGIVMTLRVRSQRNCLPALFG
jgi:hypothetical protein